MLKILWCFVHQTFHPKHVNSFYGAKKIIWNIKNRPLRNFCQFSIPSYEKKRKVMESWWMSERCLKINILAFFHTIFHGSENWKSITWFLHWLSKFFGYLIYWFVIKVLAFLNPERTLLSTGLGFFGEFLALFYLHWKTL